MTQQFADFAKALSGPNGPNRERDTELDKFVSEAKQKHGEEEEAAAACFPSSSCPREEERVAGAACRVKNTLPKHITTTVEVSVTLRCGCIPLPSHRSSFVLACNSSCFACPDIRRRGCAEERAAHHCAQRGQISVEGDRLAGTCFT